MELVVEHALVAHDAEEGITLGHCTYQRTALVSDQGLFFESLEIGVARLEFGVVGGDGFGQALAEALFDFLGIAAPEDGGVGKHELNDKMVEAFLVFGGELVAGLGVQFVEGTGGIDGMLRFLQGFGHGLNVGIFGLGASRLARTAPTSKRWARRSRQ